MRISLREYLLCGSLGSFTAGMSVAEMLSALGEPDAVGVPRRKTKKPQIYKYGDFEIYTLWDNPDVTSTISLEYPHDRKAIRFPARATDIDWPIAQRCSREAVEAYLQGEEIAFENYPERYGLKVAATGAMFSFENDWLGAISTPGS